MIKLYDIYIYNSYNIDNLWFTSSTRTRRGGSYLGVIMRPFSSIYRTCMRRAPARPCVLCALCEAVAQLLSKNMTCARPRCNATPSKLSSHFTRHSSHPALHTSHSTLHLLSNHVRSSHLISSHHIPSLLTYHLIRQVLLN